VFDAGGHAYLCHERRLGVATSQPTAATDFKRRLEIALLRIPFVQTSFTNESGIAFLSGGQSGELASARLNAMNVRFKSRLPWALTFSLGRAIQQPALEIWYGKEPEVSAAQHALYHRAKCNRAARLGEYSAAMEVP
jgi:Fructose-bisphosphate aldolase class-I